MEDSGRYVKISVADQGIGIPGTVLPNIFNPYFSTKQAGHGLGLAISHSIIARHDGYITVSSEVGEGATFDIYLPAADKQAVTVVEPEKLEVVCGTGRILLMDDEETIHRTVGRILKVLGYEVDSVDDGDEALQAYKASLDEGKAYDVVIIDLTIPGGMGGKEAVAMLHELDPQARAIVSSGYFHDPVMANYADYGFCARISKPVDLEELIDTVQRVMTEKR